MTRRGRLLDRWNEPALEEALAKRAVNTRDEAGVTPLWHAVYFGRADWVTRLLAAGAALDAHDAAKIDRASGDGHVVSLWRDIPEPGYPAPTGASTLLHVSATSRGSPAVVALLLARGVPIDARDPFGCTPLHIAAFSGHEAMVQTLLEAGADANAIDRAGHTAVDHGWSKHAVLKTLLAHRASPDGGPRVPWANSSHEWSVVTHAAQSGHVDVLSTLLQAGADLTKHREALPLAAMKGRADAVRLLLKHGAATDATTTWRGRPRGPLEAAAMYASLACAEILLPHCRSELDAALIAAIETSGDDTPSPPNDRGPARKALMAWLIDQGASPLKALPAAAATPDESYARILLDRGARGDAVDAAGEPAIVRAARSGYHRVVKVLIAHGADPKAHASDGRSAYQLAEIAYQRGGIDDARLVMAALRDAGGAPVEAPAEPAPIPSGPAVGKRVNHTKFGGGTIKALDGEKLTIAFDNGDTKVLLAKFVTLES